MTWRGRRAGWAAAAAGLLIAAAVGCGSGGSGGSGSSGSSSGSGTFKGSAFLREVWGPAVVSADGRVLTIDGYYAGCGTASTLVARQSPARVALWVRDVVVRPVAPGACAQGAPPPRQVRLAAPLGKRKLVDGASGQPILQFSARQLLLPRVLPHGYRLQEVVPLVTSPEGHPVVTVSLHYYRQSGGTGELVITESPDGPFVPQPWQSPPEPWQPPGQQGRWTLIRVRGVQGWAASAVIAWRQRGLVYSVSAEPPPPLTTAQLIAIADSAPN
jgi:hypothetical protein